MIEINTQYKRKTTAKNVSKNPKKAEISPSLTTRADDRHEYIRKLSTLIDIAQNLTSCRSSRAVLDKVLKSALTAIETADSGIFYLYDEASDLLKVQTASGFVSDIVYKLEQRPGETLSGIAFITGKATIYSTLREVTKTMTKQSRANLEYMREATGGLTFARSALVSPLKIKDRTMGVIVLDNFDREFAFNQGDLSILQSLAGQAAIALDNMQLYEQQQRLIQSLEQAIHIHDLLTTNVLQGKGIEGIVATLSSLLNNPVILFDRLGIIQAATNTTLLSTLEKVFALWLKQEAVVTKYFVLETPIFRQNIRSALQEIKRIKISPTSPGWREEQHIWQKPPVLDEPGNYPGRNSADLTTLLPNAISGNDEIELDVLVAPVDVGGTILGWVMVVPENNTPGEFDSVALEHAATIFGLEYMKQQAIYEMEVRWKGDLIDDLLAGKYSADFERRAKTLGIDSDTPLICIMIDIDDFALYIRSQKLNEEQVRRIKERMYQNLTASLRKNYGQQAFVALKSDKFISLVPVVTLNLKKRRQLAKEVSQTFQEWTSQTFNDLTVSVAISGPCRGIEPLMSALRETEAVLQLYQSNQHNFLVFTEELGADRILLQFSDKKELRKFAESILGALIEYDKNNHTDLITTLAAYCEKGKSISQTASFLFTHQNTVRYRLQRINEILEETLDLHDAWFNLELALRILKLLGERHS